MFKRFINNVRRGFATNSSSSHSMVYYKKPVASDSITYGDTEFGWESFTLTNLGSKLMYALVSAIGDWGTHDDQDAQKAYDEYGHLFPEFTVEDFEVALGGYVDHQSRNRNIVEMVELARDPHVVIYGGNDNDGQTVYEIIDGRKDVEWGADTESPSHRITPDEAAAEEYKWWR